ncbi:MAG TPA: hypothetical protein VE404_01335 [Verrucomicrobiae bacterium]|nr:hypothetical protein [Verrucomicrobiae bacterium]
MREIRHHVLAVLSFVSVLTIGIPQSAALTRPSNLEEFGRSAPVTVEGRVVGMTYARNADESLIVTWVTMKVGRVVRGHLAARRVRFRVMGGHIGDLGLLVPEEPTFSVGEDARVLLSRDDEGILRVHGGRAGKLSLHAGGTAAPSPLQAGSSEAATACPWACDPLSSPILSWPEPAMSQPLYINPTPMDGCTEDAWIASVFAAAETWNQAMAGFVFQPIVGTTELSGKGKQPDGLNVVYVGRASSQLAYTTLWFDFHTGVLLENDTVISVDKNSIHWSCDSGPQPGRYDVQGAVTHELGHFLFLPDITDGGCRDLTMYGAEFWNDIGMRSLEPPDVCGIRTLYP